MGNSAILQPSAHWASRAVSRVMESFSKQTDAHLITLALHGNRDAYGALVRRHQISAYNTARRIVILELATLAPLVGWFVLPLVVMLVGYGAVIIALVWKRET